MGGHGRRVCPQPARAEPDDVDPNDALRTSATQNGGMPPPFRPCVSAACAEPTSQPEWLIGYTIPIGPVPCLLTLGLHVSSARPTLCVGRTSVYCQPPHHSAPCASDVRAHIPTVQPTLCVVHVADT